MDVRELRGVIPPVVTVVDADGNLERRAQAGLCAWHVDQSAGAVFVAGTTGEGVALNEGLLAELVDVAVEAVAGRVPVLAGVIAPTADQALRRARIAAQAGAQAVVATAPFFGLFSPDEVETHFRRVADGSPVPVLAYSIPPMTHTPMTLEVVEALFADDVVIGLKDSGRDVAFLTGAIGLGRRHGKPVFPGFEPLAAAGLMAGAAGVVATSGNLDPAGYHQLWQAAQAGRWAEVEAVHARLRRLVADLGALASAEVGGLSAAVAGTKAGLEVMGRTPGRVVLPPLSQIPDQSMGQVRAMLTRADLI